VRQARDGKEILTSWETWQPHLIWVDAQLRADASYEAIRRIKASPQGRETAVAIVAAATEADRVGSTGEGKRVSRPPLCEADIAATLRRHLGVRFVYEEIEFSTTTLAGETDTLLTELTTMPLTWIADLRQATLEGDIDWMRDLIGQVGHRNVPLSNKLRAMAASFDHEAILRSTHLALQAITGERR
jgi:CheY-like chemotaxis protein